MKLFKKRPSRVDPDTLAQKAQKSLEKTREQQPTVNAWSQFFAERKMQNGLGEDFEISLIPKGAR